MRRATLLGYNLPETMKNPMGALCTSMGIGFRPVEKTEHSAPLGLLAGLPVASTGSREVEPFDAPMLVMCGFDEDTFNAFLEALRYSPMPRVPLKAVLTPTNAMWNGSQLYSELLREHEEMQRLRGKR